MRYITDRAYSRLLLFACLFVAVVVVFASCKGTKDYATAFDQLKNKAEASKVDDDHAIPAAKCAAWYPVHTKIVTLPARIIKGKSDTTVLPGEVRYVDCDSVKSANGSSKVVVKCPPAQIVHDIDTVVKETIKLVENTARVHELEVKLSNTEKKSESMYQSLKTYKKVSACEGIILALIGIYGVYKLYNKVV